MRAATASALAETALHDTVPAPRSGRPLRIAVLASGRGSNLQALIDARDAARLPIELAGVFSDRADAPALERARSAGIPALSLAPAEFASRREFDAAFFARVDAVQPGLIVCAGYMRLISAAAVRRRPGRMINIHPSLLPRHPGLDTHARAIAAGDTEHGASVHFVTPALDAGPVLAQVRVPVHGDDTPALLAQRVLAREHALLIESIALITSGRVACVDGGVHVDGIELARPLQLDGAGRLSAEGAA